MFRVRVTIQTSQIGQMIFMARVSLGRSMDAEVIHRLRGLINHRRFGEDAVPKHLLKSPVRASGGLIDMILETI